MQANHIDNDSGHLSDTQELEGDVRGLGNAAVHELNQIRAEALRQIDEGGFSRFHLKSCFVACTGFLTNAYDIFVINLASVMLGFVYGHTPGPGLTLRLSRHQDFGIKEAAPVGQLLFGWLGDIVGGKRTWIELIIIHIYFRSEFASTSSSRGHLMTTVFTARGWRNFAATLVALIAFHAYRDSILTADSSAL